MTATVEAIVGAAYMDGGMEAAKGVMESLRIEATIEEAIRARGDGTDHDKAAEECAPKRKRSQTDELNSCPQVTKNRKLSAESASVKASDQPKRVTSTPDSSSTQPQEERSIHSLVM